MKKILNIAFLLIFFGTKLGYFPARTINKSPEAEKLNYFLKELLNKENENLHIPRKEGFDIWVLQMQLWTNVNSTESRFDELNRMCLENSSEKRKKEWDEVASLVNQLKTKKYETGDEYESDLSSIYEKLKKLNIASDIILIPLKDFKDLFYIMQSKIEKLCSLASEHNLEIRVVDCEIMSAMNDFEIFLNKPKVSMTELPTSVNVIFENINNIMDIKDSGVYINAAGFLYQLRYIRTHLKKFTFLK